MIKNNVFAIEIGSAGSYTWRGRTSTIFQIDPEEEWISIFMTRLLGVSASFDKGLKKI